MSGSSEDRGGGGGPVDVPEQLQRGARSKLGEEEGPEAVPRAAAEPVEHGRRGRAERRALVVVERAERREERVVAVRADGGCEVMAIPSLIFGRYTHLACIVFSPIDWLERKTYELLGWEKTIDEKDA